MDRSRLLSTLLASTRGGRIRLVGLCAALGLSSCDDASRVEPRPLPRLGPIERSEQDELVADFEAEELAFEFASGRGHVNGSDGRTEDLLIEPGGADGTAHALRIRGPEPRATFHFSEIDGPAVRQDFSSCDGLRVWLQADDDTSATLRLLSEGGSLETTVQVPSSWTEFELDWSDFEEALLRAEPGFGGAGGGEGGGSGPVLREVTSLELTWASESGGFVDEIALTRCRLPQLNPPVPAPPALGSGAPAESPVARHGQLAVKGKTLVDQAGEPVQLKGLSSMWTNWDAGGFATNAAALEFMRDEWGLSVFRVALGVEPAGAYLDSPFSQRSQVERALANAISLGVYLIVDWHAHEAHDEPDAARAFFDELAADYGHYPNVIWETYNEPTGASWSEDLKPYHVSLIETIRRRDPDNLILLGTPQWSQLVDEAAADPIGARNVLYTLHFYACTHTEWLRDLADQALGAGVGLFVSEFGGTNADGGRDGAVCEAETRTWLDFLDARGISGVAWRLDNCTGEATCLLAPTAPRSGGWQAHHLKGHGPLVVEWISRR